LPAPPAFRCTVYAARLDAGALIPEMGGGSMPLSDQERRMLDEIEQGIKVALPPALASAIGLARRVSRSWMAWVLAFVLGALLLAVGVRTTTGLGTFAGVVGYLVVVFSIHQSVPAARGQLGGVGSRVSGIDDESPGEA